ncbi:MAG: hypothetical protein AAB225_31990 [Acidobacteriota bacterium]
MRNIRSLRVDSVVSAGLIAFLAAQAIPAQMGGGMMPPGALSPAG